MTKYQRLLWAGQKLFPDAAMFTNAGLAVVPAAIDLQVFTQAVQALVDANDALRMVIEDRAGRPVAVVRERVTCAPEYLDLSAAADPDAEAHAFARLRAAVPHEMDRCLFEFALLKLADRRFAMYCNVHHVVSDAGSVSAITRQLADLYDLALAGRLNEAPPQPPYAEFVRRCVEQEQGTPAARAAEFWRRRTAAAPPPLSILGRAATIRGVRVERVSVPLDTDRCERALAAARTLGVGGHEDTVLHHLFAAVTVRFLHLLSGATIICLGTPFHNRRGRESMIGLLMQILPLPIAVEPNDSCREIARRVADEHLRVLRFRQHAVGNPRWSGNYHAEFNFIPTPMAPSFAGVPVRQHWIHPGVGRDLLAIQVQRTAVNALTVHFDFHCDVFDANARDTAIARFRQVLDAALDEAASPAACSRWN